MLLSRSNFVVNFFSENFGTDVKSW